MNLSGKNVAYFGGCGGIGSETCKQLVQKNVANLAILDLSENTELIAALSKQHTKVFLLHVDVRCSDSISSCLKEVVSRMGHIDIVVNGIGIVNELDAKSVIDINLLGLMKVSLAALELMDQSKGNRGGQVVNIASIAGLDPFPMAPIYCASKGGVVLFSRSLAADFAKTGVSCITICPGLTRTQLLDRCISTSNPEGFSEQNQTPAELATNMIKAMEENKNGAVYLCDVGECNEVSFPKFWEAKFTDKA